MKIWIIRATKLLVQVFDMIIASLASLQGFAFWFVVKEMNLPTSDSVCSLRFQTQRQKPEVT